jgi:hypothetical protein
MAHECPRVFLNGAVLPWQPFPWLSLVDPQAQALVDCPSLQTLDLSQNLLTMDCGVSPGFPGTMAKENGKNRGKNRSCVWRLIKWFQSNLDELTRGWNANSMCFVAILWGVIHGMWSKRQCWPMQFRRFSGLLLGPLSADHHSVPWTIGGAESLADWEIGEPDLILPVAVEIQYIGDSHGVEGKMGVKPLKWGESSSRGCLPSATTSRARVTKWLYTYVYIYCNYIILHIYIYQYKLAWHWSERSVKTPCCLMIVGPFLGVTLSNVLGMIIHCGNPILSQTAILGLRRPSLSFISLAENLFSLRCVWSSKNRWEHLSHTIRGTSRHLRFLELDMCCSSVLNFGRCSFLLCGTTPSSVPTNIPQNLGFAVDSFLESLDLGLSSWNPAKK